MAAAKLRHPIVIIVVNHIGRQAGRQAHSSSGMLHIDSALDLDRQAWARDLLHTAHT